MLITTVALLAGCSTNQPPSAQEGCDQTVVENDVTVPDEAAVTAVDEGRAAEPQFTPLNPITKNLKVEGRSIKLTIQPEINVSGSDGSVKVDLNALVDASDFQS